MRTPTVRLPLLVCLILASGGCVTEPELEPAATGEITALPIVRAITAEDAELLVRSSLAMTSKLVIVGNIATAMARDHLDLLSGPPFGVADITQCAGSPDGHSIETNQVSYRSIAPGFPIPPGPSLRVALSNCDIEGIVISGFIDIAAIGVSGEPGGAGDWDLEAAVWLGPVEITGRDGASVSITDRMRYAARMRGGVLTKTLTVAADPDSGMIGGLNAQHYLGPIGNSTPTVNYQFRPFEIRTIEDANTGDYTVQIRPGPEGASLLSRYTTNPSAEVDLQVATTPGDPIRWAGSRPTQYTDVPVSGEVRFTEPCTGCGSILATIGDDGVTLTIQSGGAVTTQSSDWASLLSLEAAGP